ncbi:MAG TPA: HAMP domain-containing sensor histidine kinase [Candidatus Sumerlaeota bacterium]|nr:HAMP domain-containing sensor histidine kinase [Candidatus Sumerlaeota bacterium]
MEDTPQFTPSDILVPALPFQTVLILDEQADSIATLKPLLSEPQWRVLAGESLEWLTTLHREEIESVSIIFLSESLPRAPEDPSPLSAQDLETRLLPYFPLAALVLLEGRKPLDLNGHVTAQLATARLTRPLNPDAARQALNAAQAYHIWLRSAFWRWNCRTGQEVFEESIARILHDINNQITGIKGGLDLLDMVFAKLPDCDAKQQGMRYLNQFLRAGMAQTEQMIQRWRRLRGMKKQAVEHVSVLPTLRQAALALTTPAQMRHITLHIAGQEVPFDRLETAPECETFQVEAGAELLGHVLVQAIQNAIEAIAEQEDGRIWIEVGLTRNDTMVSVEIFDNGPGIPEEIRADVWRAFFSTKSGVRTGMGLAIGKQVIDKSQGQISLVPSPLGGAGLQILLPRPGQTQTEGNYFIG